LDDFELELKQDFLSEAKHMLEDTESVFLDIEKNPEDQDLLEEIFRLAHNIKGTARAVGFNKLSDFTHELENLLLKIKEVKGSVSKETIDLLLSSNDFLKETIEELSDSPDDSNLDVASLIETIKSHELTSPSSENVSDSEQEEIVFSDKDFIEMKEEEITRDASISNSISNKEEIILEIEKNKLEPIVEKQNIQKKRKKNKENKNETVKISLERIETLNNFIGELTILQTVISQYQSKFQDITFSKDVRHLNKISKEIQEISMRLRMSPIKNIFSKLQRAVRDTSSQLNKEINLDIEGENTEVDRTVLNELTDPLVHIVRNAVDHGVEDQNARLKAGKDIIGTIKIKAYHEGNNLIIDIKDDGKGIDPAIIKKKALEKSIIKENDEISDEEVINLIFHPGFSTKDEVSDISGRGVGMDVVKTNLESISGEVDVSSSLGEGSLFRIKVPLTLSIIEGMIIQIKNKKYIVPLNQIEETINLSNFKREKIHDVGESINIRGKTVLLKSLSELVERKTSEDAENIAILYKYNGSLVAFSFQEILQQQQIVIKQIGEEIKNKEKFMGVSILGDGNPSMILDLKKIS